jgi:two-component system, OmpR family, response regulator NblR
MSICHIFLMESDSTLAEQIYVDLFKAGYQVSLISDTAHSLTQWEHLKPQALIIDQLLPNSLDFVRELRDQGQNLPIILLVGGDRLVDRLTCLESGADDYLAKPYLGSELLRLLSFYLQTTPATHQKLVFGDLVLDLDTRQAVRGQRSIDLTAKEFELLHYLMTNPGETLTREQILENVWGYESGGESNVIEVYVRYLRIKLQEGGDKRIIQTVRGSGYVLREG